MEIINNKLNSLPEQVEENMKNIKLLAQYLKEAYNTFLTLNTTDTSIAISYTNASTDVTNGWLLDTDGKLFKITSGDGTNFLIEYYTNLRGPQGPSGASLEIDDNDTASFDKTWSCFQLNKEFSRSRDKGIFYTSVYPTLNDGIYTIDESNLNTTGYAKPIINDLLLYIDSNDDIVKEIWKIGGNANPHTCIKIGDFSQGTTLHQHNIVFYNNHNTNTGVLFRGRMTILHEKPTALTHEEIETILTNKSMAVTGKACQITSSLKPYYLMFGLQFYNNEYWCSSILLGNDNGGSLVTVNTSIDLGTFQNDGTTVGVYIEDRVDN